MKKLSKLFIIFLVVAGVTFCAKKKDAEANKKVFI
jgi:hypothetical protein